jgi:hypothetical protein
MVKAIHGILYKGFSDPLSNLDPDGSLNFGSYDLVICRKCLKLYGRLVRVLDESTTGEKRSGWRYQKCRCMKDEDKKNGVTDKLWPGNDFNTSVEFCHCCAKRLINSGSKFSSFYCNDCLKLIKENNAQPGNYQVPLGRHSFMHGIYLQAPFTDEDEKQFNKKVNKFFNSLDLILEWQNLSLFENLHELGINFKRDISLSYYDKLIQKSGDDSLKKFRQMMEFIYYKFND